MKVGIDVAEGRLLYTALRLSADQYNTQQHAHSGDDTDYMRDMLALAARDYVCAVEKLDQKPVGWDQEDY